MLANTMEISRIEINCDHTWNERKIYDLVIIQYSTMDFTNYSSCINAISLDVKCHYYLIGRLVPGTNNLLIQIIDI